VSIDLRGAGSWRTKAWQPISHRLESDGLQPKPEFERCLAKVGCSGSEGGEVCSSSTELVPQEARGVACELHGMSLPEDRPVEMLCPSIVRRRLGGHHLVVHTIGSAPVLHSLRD
jgi:hypothetical protein